MLSSSYSSPWEPEISHVISWTVLKSCMDSTRNCDLKRIKEESKAAAWSGLQSTRTSKIHSLLCYNAYVTCLYVHLMQIKIHCCTASPLHKHCVVINNFPSKYRLDLWNWRFHATPPAAEVHGSFKVWSRSAYNVYNSVSLCTFFVAYS
jgi:hypothetical protein